MILPVMPDAAQPAPRSGFRRDRARRGNALIEFTFIMPWYIFLFVGAFDFGFYSYSLIATETAAHAGAIYCSSLTSSSPCADSSTSTHCNYALDQLRMLPNVGGGLTSCGTSTTVTSSAPVAVSSSNLSAANSPDGYSPAAAVTVVYITPQLIPIPGLLPGQVTITRTVTLPYGS